MAQADGGYSLPSDFSKDTVQQIFGYSTAEELEQFLRKCPRHYLRNYFAEVYLGSADRVHEIRSNNDKYLLNKLVQAIRAAGIPVDVGSRRQGKGKQDKLDQKQPSADSPQKALPRQSGRNPQPATFSLVARAGPGISQPMPTSLNAPLPLSASQWAGEGPSLPQLAQIQAMMQQQLMMPGLLQYYQNLMPALHQGLLGPHAQLQQDQLQQLAAFQAQIPALVTDGPPLSLLPFFQQPSPLVTGAGSVEPPKPGSPAAAKIRAASRSTATDPSREWTEDGSGCSDGRGDLPPGTAEADTGSDSDLQEWKQLSTRRKLSESKRVAKGKRGAPKSRTQQPRQRRRRSSSTATPEPPAAADDSASAFQALLSAVEVAQNEEA